MFFQQQSFDEEETCFYGLNIFFPNLNDSCQEEAEVVGKTRTFNFASHLLQISSVYVCALSLLLLLSSVVQDTLGQIEGYFVAKNCQDSSSFLTR